MSFPPDIVVAVKALACELPSEVGLPLSRFSMSEIRREAIRRGLVASIGETTLWRWLSEDAIRPWHHRSWIFPRDPDFANKASRVLDLYEAVWDGQPLGPTDYVVCADEKTSIQARRRKHRTGPVPAGRPMRVEHEYTRKGAWAYLAAWDVHQARIFGRCEAKTGIRPFERLVRQVMSQEPYRSASRVFWVVDNGSSHRGARCQQRLARRWPNLIVVHTPIHASWLNQVEIYFSVLQRKVLTPNDFNSLTALEDRLLNFQSHYQAVANHSNGASPATTSTPSWKSWQLDPWPHDRNNTSPNFRAGVLSYRSEQRGRGDTAGTTAARRTGWCGGRRRAAGAGDGQKCRD